MAEESSEVAVPVPESNTVTTTADEASAQTNGHDVEMKDNDATAAPTKEASASAQEDGAAPVAANGDGADDVEADASATNGKDKKRSKSGAGVPEHKAKKANKRKAAPTVHLDCKPGQYYWARLKGYPPWPSVICDEAMLPESLLATRPVSTARPDGSIREDFQEGGKNAKERTFPIMFMQTNEFMWMINTSLTPLDPEECKNVNTSKMTKALKGAYETAAEAHPLQHFKDLLKSWQEELEAHERAQAEAEAEWNRAIEEEAVKTAEAAEAKSKKASRKSKGGAENGVDDAETSKSSKKRKKDAESDAEGAKPKKTPKVTKINAPKTPGEETASTKKPSTSSKPKKRVVSPPKEEELEVQPSMTEEERLAQREKHVLYLRHRLQKGFLTRDQAPQESEMPSMHEFFAQLEAFENLESSVVRSTKIHKVLKGIVKIASIPLDEQYYFKKRSAALLEVWNKKLESEGETKGEANGDADDEPKAAAVTATNGDVEMKDADEAPKKEPTEEKDTVPQAVDEKQEENDKTAPEVTAPAEAAPVAATEAEKGGDTDTKATEETLTA